MFLEFPFWEGGVWRKWSTISFYFRHWTLDAVPKGSLATGAEEYSLSSRNPFIITVLSRGLSTMQKIPLLGFQPPTQTPQKLLNPPLNFEPQLLWYRKVFTYPYSFLDNCCIVVSFWCHQPNDDILKLSTQLTLQIANQILQKEGCLCIFCRLH